MTLSNIVVFILAAWVIPTCLNILYRKRHAMDEEGLHALAVLAMTICGIVWVMA